MKSCKTSANCQSGWDGLCIHERVRWPKLFRKNGALRKSGAIRAQTQPIWIKDPLSILADGAERGVVVRGGRIVELVPRGREPVTANTAVYDASAHVVLPGLINPHHHFYQTLTRALPAALDRELFPWLQALYPVWARLTPESLHLGVTVAMSELLLSVCPPPPDHHYVFPAGLEDAIDIEVAVTNRLGMRVLLTRGSMNRSQRDGGLPPDSG